jgi:NAD(P)H-dependent FMN reductase
MISIGILVGSLRKDSYNMKIAKYIVKNYSDKANFEIIDIKDFPLFNEDLEDNIPESVLYARKQVKGKDGIIIVSPEYNHSISGVMKNALDWFSRDDYVMMKKPYLIMGASDGSIGTARMQGHLRQVLNSGAFQMYSAPYNEFIFARIQDNMDEYGNITNEGSIKRLNNKIDGFVQFIGTLRSNVK